MHEGSKLSRVVATSMKFLHFLIGIVYLVKLSLNFFRGRVLGLFYFVNLILGRDSGQM